MLFLQYKGKIEVKTKGVTLDTTNAKLVNFDSLKKMVLEDAKNYNSFEISI